MIRIRGLWWNCCLVSEDVVNERQREREREILLTILFLFLTDNLGLMGTIPDEITVFSSLRTLFAYGNNLNGALPSNFGSMRELTELDLEENSLQGDPWSVLTPLTNLRRLRLSSNMFAGTLPTAIGALAELRELWMADNMFMGSLPTQLGFLSALRKFKCGTPSQLWLIAIVLISCHFLHFRIAHCVRKQLYWQIANGIGQFGSAGIASQPEHAGWYYSGRDHSE